MIPGISDRRRLPRLGKIRLGEKRESSGGKLYPAALDHFNFRDVQEVEKVYGKNCREIDVMVPVEDLDTFFEQARKAYRKSGLFCKCGDGKTAFRVRVGKSDGKTSKIPAGQSLDPHGEEMIQQQGLDVDVGDMFELPCIPEECPFAQGERAMCKPIGRLMFLMPKVPKFGCYEISTSSVNSILQVNSAVDMIRTMAGRISMIALKLRLEPIQVQVDGKAKTVHVLNLLFEGDWTKFLRGGYKALPGPLHPSQLPSPKELDREIPDDLMPGGGETLGEQVGEAAEPEKKQEVGDGDAAAEARAALTEDGGPDGEGGEPWPGEDDPGTDGQGDQAKPTEVARPVQQVPAAKPAAPRDAAPREAAPRPAAPRPADPRVRPDSQANPQPKAPPKQEPKRAAPTGRLF